MNPPIQFLWCRWSCYALLAGLIMAVGIPASAQPETKLGKNVLEYLSFKKLPERARLLIRSAINNYDNGEHQKSVDTLQILLAEKGIYKPKRSLRAWIYQWLALNHTALKDSVAIIKEYAKLSLEEDVEIWREYADLKIMSCDLRDIYQDVWDELQYAFDKKRHSWRLGLGTISRVDYSYRSRFLEVLTGIGAPIVADLEGQEIRFKQLLFYVRLQRARKSIERLFAGYYFEFSLLEEDLSGDEWNELQFTKAISGGLVLGYAYKSGWEFGGSFEVARLLLKDSTSSKLDFSQTVKIGEFSQLQYGNFEIYIRKWF